MTKKFNLVSPDPNQPISNIQLEKFILFAIAVAGKKASTIEVAIDTFLSLEKGISPFWKIRKMMVKNTLVTNLKKARLGRYKVLSKAYSQLVTSNINLRTCTIEDLENISGIGQKTSRFFILHTRPKQRLAVLDRYILHYLKHQLHVQNVPNQTPSSKTVYNRLEKEFINHADALGISLVELDSYIWNMYSKYNVL